MERMASATAATAATSDKMLIKPNVILIDRYIRINKEQYMFFLQLLQECDIYDYEIYNEEQIIRKGRNIFQIKNNGKQYHYLLTSRSQTYFLKFYFYRIVGKSNEIQLIDEKFLFIDVNKWLKENKNSTPIASSQNTYIPKNNVHMVIKPITINTTPIELGPIIPIIDRNIAQTHEVRPVTSVPEKNLMVKEYIQQQQQLRRNYSNNGEEDEDEEYGDGDGDVDGDIDGDVDGDVIE